MAVRSTPGAAPYEVPDGVRRFAEEVGPSDPVACTGWGTRWPLVGAVPAGARVVRAPSGVVRVVPEEMVVVCGAATPVEELQAALGDHGQFAVLPPGGTVGGALALGRSPVTRLGHGPVRDTLLQAFVVTATGDVARLGGPTVKNVSGYDLCRLVVGSLGTLAFLGEVVLRTRPVPAVRRWFVARGGDPFALIGALHRPTAVLWDGTDVWVCLEGHPADVREQAALAGLGDGDEVGGPPPLPSGGRWSLPPSQLRNLPAATGAFVAEVGVGIVHAEQPPPPASPPAGVLALHREVKRRFDPEGRLNPGVAVLPGM